MLLVTVAPVEGKVQLLHVSPESLLINSEWREMLQSDVYRENLVAFQVLW